MKIAILGSRGGWHEAQLDKAFRARGAEPLILPVTALAARLADGARLSVHGRRIDDCDAVVVRAIPPGSLEQIIFRVDALHRLVRLGMPVINSPRCIERSVDKYLTSALLEDAGLPTPRTVVCERFDDAMAGFTELGGDVIVKPLFGAEGRGMPRVSDPDVAYRVFRALELVRGIFYIQEYVPHGGRDVRVLVIGGGVAAAMIRKGDGWKTNIAQGARAEPFDLPPDLAELSRRAAELLEADYAGVDLLPADDGRIFVIEVNGIPGWQGLQRTTEVDIAGAIAGHAMDAASRRRGLGPRPDVRPRTGRRARTEFEPRQEARE
jgi:RimK family alpha-L-glutamate ligase